MAKLAFILLCHKDPAGVIAQARRLTAEGDLIAIHFDGNGRREDFESIREALADNPSVIVVPRRHKCGWGTWSLVAATLETLRAAEAGFPQASHFYMLSGDCMPIKSAEYAHAFLDAEDCDYIESFDFFESGWIKTGFREDRLIYRHFFNERKHRWLFYACYDLQRRLNLTRALPADLQIMIGSQWWCLRRETVEKVLAFCRQRRDVIRFFRTTWIPDETFFQTIVRHLVPREQIHARTLTFLLFTDYGMPVTFHDDHFDMLLAQDYLFARKISPEAEALKLRLGRLWSARGRHFPISGNGHEVFRFLVGQGRVGRRFGRRFWESEASLGRDRTLLMIVCKKWGAARRLIAALRDQTGIPAVGFLFNELDAGLPDLGGVETSLDKRDHHRRALLRLLMDIHGADRLAICVDPYALGLIRDLLDDKAETRLLLIDVEFDETWMRGHMQRIGLTGPQTTPSAFARLERSARIEMAHEIELLRDLPGLHVISPAAGPARNGEVLARFLGVDAAMGAALAATPHIFDD